jgi:antitoxin YefM
MRHTTYSDFRKNLATVIDQVNDDHDPILITRSGGKASAVLMSAEDFATWEETIHLMSSPRNAEDLMSSIAQHERGESRERKLIE